MMEVKAGRDRVETWCRQSLLLWLLAILLGGSTVCAVPPPNVIIIYGDDVGYGDVGAYGAKGIPTPNIDRLARNGLRFTDGHSGSATCTPSRYSMLTGNAAFRKDGTGILPGDAKLLIDPEQFTLPDLFKEAGYVTGVIGKWHLGLGDDRGPIDWNKTVEPGPAETGFDYSYILPATNDRVPCVYMRNGRIVNLDPDDPITVDYAKPLVATYPDAQNEPESMTFFKSVYGHNNSVINGIGRIGWMAGGVSAIWDDEMMADELVKEAKGFITRNRNKRFFLYFASQDIHVPRVPHPRFRGKSEFEWRGDAMVQLDWTVGQILQELEDHGLLENTLVIFSSDNGPVYNDGYADGSEVERSWEEIDRGHDGSGVFRGGKYQIHEGGTRVPLIISWASRIEPGISDVLISQLDFLASFAALFDKPLPPGSGYDSRNLLSSLLGEKRSGKGIIVQEAFAHKALRRGSWKFIPARIGRLDGAKLPAELYDLHNDPGEQRNLAEIQLEQTLEMTSLLERIIGEGVSAVSSQPLNR